MNRSNLARLLSAASVAALVGTGSLLAQPAFRMGVGLSDSANGNQSVAYSSLVGEFGPLTVGYYYQGKEVGAVLPVTLSGTPANNFLSSLGVEIFLVNPVNNLGVTFNLYDVGPGGVPTGVPIYSLSGPVTLAGGAHELLIEDIPNIDGLFDLNGRSEVALTVLFNGLNPGEGGLSLAGPVGEAIEREVIPGTVPISEFFTIAVAIPETSTVAGGVFLALACGGLCLKRRKF